VGSIKVLENFSWGPGKVLDFFSVKEWEPWIWSWLAFHFLDVAAVDDMSKGARL